MAIETVILDVRHPDGSIHKREVRLDPGKDLRGSESGVQAILDQGIVLLDATLGNIAANTVPVVGPALAETSDSKLVLLPSGATAGEGNNAAWVAVGSGSTLVAAADITDATATGQAAITAADAAALREVAGISGLSVSGATATATWTALNAPSTAASLSSLSIGGEPVTPLAQIAEAGSILKVRGIASRATENLRKGIYADGTDEAFTIPSRPELEAIGSEDHSLVLPTFILPDWSPAAEVLLLAPTTANSGIKLALTTAGHLKLSLGDGTSYTHYTSAEAIGANLPAWSALHIGIALDRNGNASLYIDGGVFESFDTSAQETDDLSSGGYTVLDASAGYTLGYFGVFNRVLTANEFALAYHMPDWITRVPSVPILYYAAGGGTGGWAAINTTLTQETVGGRANVLKVTASIGNNQKRIRHTDAGVVTGKQIFILFDYYIPSGQAEITTLQVQTNSGNTGAAEVPNETVTDTWTTVAVSATALNPGQIDFVPNDGGTTISNVTVAGQYIALDNIRVYRPGAACLIDLSIAGATKTDLVGISAASANATRGTNAEDTL